MARDPASVHRATKTTQKRSRPTGSPASTGSHHTMASTSNVTSSSAPVTPSAPPVAAPSPPLVSGGSPVGAVESFYHLAASHQYAAAWALADASFRQELAGYQGLVATMAREQEIIFHAASVLNESANNATVAVRTTSLRSDGTQSCSGTVNLLRAGSSSPGWLLDHISISCV
jgi:hypothetical protein